MKDFKGNIQQVPELINEQFKSYGVFSSWYPGHWQNTFKSLEEAINFIGFKELRKLEWTLEEEQSILNVYGNESGEILSVTLETIYVLSNIRIQEISSIYTEEYDDLIEIDVRTTESLNFEETYYESPNHVISYIISSSSLESGYYVIDGYLVQEGILYNISIAYQKDDKNKAEELLYEWVNLF